MFMKASIATLAATLLTLPAWADDWGGGPGVPEVSSTGSLAAIVAVAALAAILFERRRRA